MEAARITPLWNAYCRQEPITGLEKRCDSADSWFYLAILSYAGGHDSAAASYAATAHRADPSRRLYDSAARHLAGNGAHGRDRVYTDPEGFAAFIRGGGNVGLYGALSRRLRECYAQSAPVRLLDIGVGDGLALLPALSGDIAFVDLLEPSASLLQATATAVAARGIGHQTVNAAAQQLGGAQAPWPSRPWTIAQATFSLHNVPRAERHDLLRGLRANADRLLVAEFDAPAGAGGLEPEAVAEVCSRYERGLAEYDGDEGLVGQGFLMPVMFGYFDPSTTHEEQPIADWRTELAQAGFTRQRPATRLFDYWWAPAYLMDVSADPEQS